jgi:hypothetical protein
LRVQRSTSWAVSAISLNSSTTGRRNSVSME